MADFETPKELRYSQDHEWCEIAGNIARIGITDYAQDALTDVVYVELPDVGEEFTKGDSMGVVESVKSVSDIFAPVSGKIIEINETLNDNPELLNEQPYAAGWILAMEMSDPSEADELLDSDGYVKLVAE